MIVSRETFGQGRKVAKRGTTKCSLCDNPRLETSAYCREHHNAYRRAWRARERERIAALEKAAGAGWIEPA